MDKYDRQIRLWTGNGQHALRETNVLVLGFSLALTEAMKNLCLAGVGHITIVDNANVSKTSILHNYFFSQQDEGCSRAHVMRRAMAELNPDTTVDCHEADPSTYFRANDFASRVGSFRVVLASPTISMREFSTATAILLGNDSSLDTVFLQPVCTGVLGVVSSYFREFISHQTHGPRLPDLRYGTSSWPDLARFVDSYGNLTDLTDAELENVPYPVILEVCLREWAIIHQGKTPSSSEEKKEFKASVKQLARSHIEENISEALRTCWQVWKSKIPESILDIFALAQAENPKNSKWLLIKALKLFIERTGQLPVSGKIPDMNIKSAVYRDFQKLYTDKAEVDLAVFTEIYDSLFKEQKDVTSRSSPEDLRSFCLNAANLRVIIGDQQSPFLSKPMFSPLQTKSGNIFKLMAVASEIISSPDLTDWEAECNRVIDSQLLNAETDIPEQLVHSLLVAKGLEIHSVATTIGAIASQEVIKHVIMQYTPLAHHLAYDASCSWAEQITTAQVH